MEQIQITLEALTTDSVNIKKQNYYYREGKEPTPLDLPMREALQNSTRDRERLKEVLGEDSHEYKAVMQMWGNEPTIVEVVPEPMMMPEEIAGVEEELPEEYEVGEEVMETIEPEVTIEPNEESSITVDEPLE